MKRLTLLLKAAICLLVILSDKQLYAQANVTLSNLTSPTAVNVNLLPGAGNKYNLGSSSKSWKNLYLDGDMYIDGNRFTYLPTSTSTFVGNTANTTSTGVGNSALGYHVLMNNTSGVQNSGLGAYPLEFNTTGRDNAALGYAALNSNTTGSYNCAIGSFSLFDNTSSDHNTAVGYNSLRNNNLSGGNSAFGAEALYANTEGYENTANGSYALYSNTTGYLNTAIGNEALYSNTTGKFNVATGNFTLYWNSTGEYNTATGYQALNSNFTGTHNTANGAHSGSYSAANTYCTFIGYDADKIIDGASTNSTAVGNSSRITASNQVRIGNSLVTSIGGYQPWTNISDGRYKKEIKENVPGIEFINKLKPVTYNLDVRGIRKFLGEDLNGEEGQEGFKEKSAEEKALIEKGESETEQVIYTGFIAQEVEQAATEIGFVFSGVDKPQNEHSLYGLRYSEFVVPLVKAVQELSEENKKLSETILEEQSKNSELEKRMEKLEQLFSSATISDEKLNTQVVTLTGAKLEQNIPNPFEQSTTIKYFIPDNSGDTKINIYSERGEIIKSITVTEKGNGQIILNAADLASGAYQYALVINGQVVATKQMIRTK